MKGFVRYVACLGVAAAFLGCSSPEKRETAGQYMDDSVITSKVKAAIVDDMALKGMQVSVKTYQGVVQLSGFVDTPQQAKEAERVASRVDGVKEVRNDLLVK